MGGRGGGGGSGNDAGRTEPSPESGRGGGGGRGGGAGKAPSSNSVNDDEAPLVEASDKGILGPEFHIKWHNTRVRREQLTNMVTPSSYKASYKKQIYKATHL